MKTKQLFAVGMTALMLMGCGSSAGRIRFGAAGLGGMYQAFGDAFAKLTEEEMGLTEAEICNGKTPGYNGEKGQMTFQETLEKLKEHFPKKQD